jgi:hypothetical protein
MGWIALGELGSGPEMVAALRRLREEGHGPLDAYSPFPVEGTREALDLPRSWLRWAGLLAGIFGTVAAYVIQWFCNAVDFPINVGNRPPHSSPAFIPITFETLVLSASVAIFVSALVAWGLPRLNHPVFAAEGFESATDDGYWVAVAADTPARREAALAALRALGARKIQAVSGGLS